MKNVKKIVICLVLIMFSICAPAMAETKVKEVQKNVLWSMMTNVPPTGVVYGQTLTGTTYYTVDYRSEHGIVNNYVTQTGLSVLRGQANTWSFPVDQASELSSVKYYRDSSLIKSFGPFSKSTCASGDDILDVGVANSNFLWGMHLGVNEMDKYGTIIIWGHNTWNGSVCIDLTQYSW